MDWWIAASGATSADGTTATGTHSSAWQTGGVPVADASRHDRDVLPLASCKRGPDVRLVGHGRRGFHTYLYLPTYPPSGRRTRELYVRERAPAYAGPTRRHTRVYKYRRDSTRRISNNRAVKYRRFQPGQTLRLDGFRRVPPSSNPSRDTTASWP